MRRRPNYAGLVIAGTGFFLTRFTVTLALYEDPVRFYLAGVVPLVLGLGLAAVGVALTVARVEASLVRTTAVWCLVGAGTMLVLVVLTLLGSTPGGLPAPSAIRSRAYLSNFLIGGSVGGTLTGLYAARNRRQRGTLRGQANRLAVLNRLLRHEVLNAVTAIRGYAAVDDGDARTVIEERADAIEATIEEVGYLTRTAGPADAALGAVDLADCLRASADAVRERHPDADVSVDPVPPGLAVAANDRLGQVFTHLLANAVEHDPADDPAVEVAVRATPTGARVAVSDRGPGLPASQRALLEDGEIREFDDPGTGFGLNVVRFLVEGYGGAVETDVGPDGTTVTVELPRADADADGAGLSTRSADPLGLRPALPDLVVTLGAALAAGVAYGLAAEALGGSVSIIGVFYGVRNPVVGWITHEFHSVVFGFVFAGLVSFAPPRYRGHLPAHVAIATAWALVLWFVAAGFVSAIWLRLLGIPAPVPSLSVMTLGSHLAWGVSLGALTAVGYERLTPRLARLGERVGRARSRA